MNINLIDRADNIRAHESSWKPRTAPPPNPASDPKACSGHLPPQLELKLKPEGRSGWGRAMTFLTPKVRSGRTHAG
jgi:hypothetical protein